MKIQINLKIDPIIKYNATKQAHKLGLSLSSVVNAVLSQFARTGELHISTVPRITPYLEELVEEARKEYVLGLSTGPFISSHEMIQNLDS
jgi:antitoxin component of RelBE/YafQ-DinJ toxin-antitoxin module